MIAVPRKPGAALSTTNVRGVLAAPRSGRLVQRCVRKQLAPHFHFAARETQCGGLPGKGTLLCTHQSRLHLARSRRRKQSAAILFADAIGAFYNGVTEEVLGPLMSAERRQQLLGSLGYGDDEVADFFSLIQTGCELQIAQVPRRLQELLAAWTRTQHFEVGCLGRDRIGVTWRGTRPGEVLADLLFKLLFGRVLRATRRRLADEGVITAIDKKAGAIFEHPRGHSRG